MTHRRLLSIILAPSAMSGVLAVLVAVAVVGLVAWTEISHSQLFYNYLFGPYGFSVLWLNAPDKLAWPRRILHSTIAYDAVVIAAAAFVGLAVYSVLQIVRRMARGTSSIWRELHMAGQDQNTQNVLQEQLAGFIARAGSVLAWAVYGAIFFGILLPVAAQLIRHGINDIAASLLWGWLYELVAVALLAAALHLHVTFLRMVLLRLRVFGEWIL